MQGVQMAWRVFLMDHCTSLNTKSFRWRPIIHNRRLLKKNQIWLSRLSVLHKGWSKRHCIKEKGYLRGESYQMMLTTYRHPCWASGQLNNMCSTVSSNCMPPWGQLLSTSAKVFLRHSFTATALCITDHRKATYLCAYTIQHWITMCN